MDKHVPLERLSRKAAIWGPYTRRRAAALLSPGVPGRRILFHIGPHKTGTTTIQATLDTNASRLSPLVQVLARRDPAVDRLCHLSRVHSAAEEFAPVADAFRRAAHQLARSCRHLPNVLISNEDLMGILPTRERGLYPTGAEKLRIVAEAMAEEGTDIHVIFYRRRYRDWINSVQSYTKKGRRPMSRVDAIIRRYGLDTDWNTLVPALRAAVPAGQFHEVSFEDDRRDGRLGAELLRLAGVDDILMEGLRWSEPKNVTRPSTVVAQPGPSPQRG